VRQNKDRAPASSYHPSHDVFEDDHGFSSTAIEATPTGHSEAKKQALLRDYFQCMLSRRADIRSLCKMPLAEQQLHKLVNVRRGGTNFCYIFPPSINGTSAQKMPTTERSTKYSRNIGAIISGFGDIDIHVDLTGDKLFNLSNGFTLHLDLHQPFNDLALWLEEVPADPDVWDPQNPTRVHFTTSTTLPFPDPRYLAIHAVVCRVAHMSGVPEYLNLEWEERLPVLARDGSSARILEFRLEKLLIGEDMFENKNCFAL
ncbi:hypothetical protein CPB83DRAFT_774144, partial [Crepidotus variabilis]